MTAAPELGDSRLERSGDAGLRCAGCPEQVCFELLPPANTRWRACALGEATTLVLERGHAPDEPDELVMGAADFVALWRSPGSARFLVDVREPAAFAARHLRGSTSVPWWALDKGVAQLPVASEPVLVLAPADCLHALLAFSLIRGRRIRAACADSAELWAAAAALDDGPPSAPGAPRLPLLTSAAAGSVSRRSWAPTPLLERHLALLWPQPALRQAEGEEAPIALDLGCGSGRDAVFLAAAGWAVVAVDSDARALVRLALLAAGEGLQARPMDAPGAAPPSAGRAPAEAALARSPSPAWAARRGAVGTLWADLSVGSGAAPHGAQVREGGAASAEAHRALDALPRPHLVLFVRYLNRPLLRWARARVRPGGAVVVAHFLRGAELVGRQRPRRPEDMLERGELLRLFAGGGAGAGVAGGDGGEVGAFDIELNDEGAEAEDGRPMVFFVARRRQLLVTSHTH